MNVKKTIAAIAAAAITASAMSVAVLADNTPNAGISTYAVPDRDHSGCEAGVDGIKGTGTVTTTDGDGVTNVTVTLTPEAADSSIEGTSGQGGENYHVVLNVPGIGSGWKFVTGGADGGQYDFDEEGNHEYNIADNQLKLWLPITADGSYKIVIQNGDNAETKKVIVVTTKHGTFVVEPEPEAPAETPEEETPEETTPPAEGDDEDLPSDDDNVTPPADDNDKDNAVVADGSASVGVVTGASSSSEAATVSTPAQVAATRNPNLTVNAGEASVSSDMLTAFVKNDDAKTLTLSYSSTLKIAVDKDDVSDTSADLDISVSTEGFLSAKEIKKLDATKVVQIDLEGEGKIEGVDKVVVKYRVGAKLAGKEVTVYEYVNGKLVKIGTGKVTANGFVNFKTDHYGQFVIAVE